MQISYQLKAAKKQIEKAIVQLVDMNKLIKRQLAKNTILYFLPLEHLTSTAQQVPQVLQNLSDAYSFFKKTDE